MAKTVKQAKADIYLRDTDSQSLFNNSGVLSFKYYHEWNDCYNPVTDKTAQIDGEVYDEEMGAYKPNCPEGYSPVFNGRLSALWDNMVACFPEKIQSTYKAMRDNGLSYKDMMVKYKEFWRYWCENIYNADAFGYANTNNFTKAYGDKVMVMDFFFQKRQRYLDSKYCCGSSASNNLRLRLYETGKGLAIKYYQAIYSSLQWGANNFSTQRNIEPGTYSYMPFGFSNPQDATFDIDDADLITELSTYTKSSNGYTVAGLEGLGDFKFDLNMGLLKRLTKFVMNYTVAKPNTKEQGDNFDMSGMKMLKQVIVRNVKNLAKSIVIASDIVEEIDFTNTPIVGITTPPSDSLVKLVLPDTIKSLKLKGYTNLQQSGLSIAGYANIDEFEVEGCPNLDSYNLLKTCYDAGAPLTQITLKGIDWKIDDIDFLLYLAENKANLQGKITLASNIKIKLSDAIKFVSAWGDITNVNNSLYVSYSLEEINAIVINGKNYLGAKGDYAYEISPTPANGNNIKSVSWSINENTFATISNEGVVNVKTVGNENDDDKFTISVVVTTLTGEIFTDTKEVKVYRKACVVGDYVFSDGTYGSKLEDSKCTPVAVVLYIEPKKREYAIATTLTNVNALGDIRNWGIGDTNVILQDNPNKSAAFVDKDNVINSISTFRSLANVIDENNITNDNFREYSKTNNLGDIGFITIDKETYTQYKKYLSDIGLKEGDLIANGQLRTIKIIAHRDMVLTDSGINLTVPKEGAQNTELKELKSLISNNPSKYYYLYASNCYAYYPTKLTNNEKLADCLKLHHWFLGSSGEISRINFYQQRFSKYDIFKQSIDDGLYSLSYPTWTHTMPSSTEYTATEYFISAGNDLSRQNCLKENGGVYPHFPAMVTIKIK